MTQEEVLGLIRSFKGLAKDKITAAIKKFSKAHNIPLAETHLKIWLDYNRSVVDGQPTEEEQLAGVGYTLVRNSSEVVVPEIPFHEISEVKIDFLNIKEKSDLVIKYLLSKIMAENSLEPSGSHAIMLLHPSSGHLLVAAMHNEEGNKKVYTFSEIFEE